MSAKKYHVSLTKTQREELTHRSKSQRHSERERKRARILLLAYEAKEGAASKDADIAQKAKVMPLIVNRMRQRFASADWNPACTAKSKRSAKCVFSTVTRKHIWSRSCEAFRPTGTRAGVCIS